MSLTDCGAALVIVYGNGRLEASFLHIHDGGEAYMGPLLRKAVQYAKTHYDSGNIVDVLLSEGEMRQIDVSQAADAAKDADVRHIYYVTYRWDPEMTRKTYRVRALHLIQQQHAAHTDVPAFAAQIPEKATNLA